jgi:hypothetical protein
MRESVLELLGKEKKFFLIFFSVPGILCSDFKQKQQMS